MGKKNSKLSAQEIEKLTQSTHFTPKELNTWYRGFLNDCPSGTLNKEEFCKRYLQFFPFGDPTNFASYIFHMFDVDQNGLIEFKEFVVGLSITSRGTLEEKVQWTFRLYDTNHDGYISREEMESVVNSIHKMVGHMVTLEESAPQKRVDMLFEKMDLDRDGQISLEEFLTGARNDPSITEALSLYEKLL